MTAQTKTGALKAVETTRQRYGQVFFIVRASKAGQASAKQPNKGRFTKGDPRASQAGLKSIAKRRAK